MDDFGDISVDLFNKNDDFKGLLDMPVEIIEAIFATTILEYTDVINASQVCGKLYAISKNIDVWKQKLRQRWPHMLARYEGHKSYNWYNEFKDRYRFGRIINSLIQEFSPRHFLQDELSTEDFGQFSSMLTEHDEAGEFMIDELMHIVNDGEPHNNLTLKYYAEKVLRCMQQMLLSKKIKCFMGLPVERQWLETGASFLAQWCQPTENITVNAVGDQLDSLASEVKHNLRATWPRHPAVTVKIDPESVTRDLWSCDQSKLVLDAINRVMFHKHHFQGNKTKYYHLTNSYIDKVLTLETGIPITLSIVYSAIARRLGVVCEPVNAPSHFLLRWKEDLVGSVEHMYTYIDVFNQGKFLSYGQLHTSLNVPESALNPDSMKITHPSQVLERMIRNLVHIGREYSQRGDNICLRNALELSILISPDDFEQRLLLVRVNLQLNINLPDVISNLQLIADDDQNRMGLVAYLMHAAHSQMEENKQNKERKKIKFKTRKKPKDALYSVGLIMKHRRWYRLSPYYLQNGNRIWYDYNCVIYGWDPKCEASEEWIIQMGVNHLSQRHKQPFYNVLVEDGTNRYAAEESLELNTNSDPINHPEVGRYFTSYQHTHYLPNAEKMLEYPDDVDMTTKLVHEKYHG